MEVKDYLARSNTIFRVMLTFLLCGLLACLVQMLVLPHFVKAHTVLVIGRVSLITILTTGIVGNLAMWLVRRQMMGQIRRRDGVSVEEFRIRYSADAEPHEVFLKLVEANRNIKAAEKRARRALGGVKFQLEHDTLTRREAAVLRSRAAELDRVLERAKSMHARNEASKSKVERRMST